MRFLLSLLFTISLSTISRTMATETFDPSVVCSLVVNGTKIKDPRACNAWIECIDGQPISGTCEAGDFYDRATKVCVPQMNTTCISSNPCAVTSESKVFVADPYSCTGYYYCVNGIATHGQCPNNMNYDSGTKNCVLDFPCKLEMDPDSYCNTVPDGVFIKNMASCNGYQLCWNGEVINGTCPGTFNFNPSTGYCDYPKKVDCVQIVTNPPDAPNPSDVCTKDGLFVSDGQSCDGYYLCHENATDGMELLHAKCPSGRFFSSGDGGACVPRTQIVCPYDRCIGLGEPRIQLSNLSNDSCRGYGLCQNGVSIGYGTCPTNEYFDEITQLCTRQIIRYPACTGTEKDSSNSTDDTTFTSIMAAIRGHMPKFITAL